MVQAFLVLNAPSFALMHLYRGVCVCKENESEREDDDDDDVHLTCICVLCYPLCRSTPSEAAVVACIG